MFENERNRRCLFSALNEQDSDFKNNRLTNIVSITFNRNQFLNEEVNNKQDLDNELENNALLKFDQILENNWSRYCWKHYVYSEKI